MGGIKHNKWFQNPADARAKKDMPDTNDPLELSAWYAQNSMVFCSVCAGQILQTDQNEFGYASDWETEQRIGMHQKCFNEFIRRRQDGNQGR